MDYQDTFENPDESNYQEPPKEDSITHNTDAYFPASRLAGIVTGLMLGITANTILGPTEYSLPIIYAGMSIGFAASYLTDPL